MTKWCVMVTMTDDRNNCRCYNDVLLEPHNGPHHGFTTDARTLLPFTSIHGQPTLRFFFAKWLISEPRGRDQTRTQNVKANNILFMFRNRVPFSLGFLEWPMTRVNSIVQLYVLVKHFFSCVKFKSRIGKVSGPIHSYIHRLLWDDI